MCIIATTKINSLNLKSMDLQFTNCPEIQDALLLQCTSFAKRTFNTSKVINIGLFHPGLQLVLLVHRCLLRRVRCSSTSHYRLRLYVQLRHGRRINRFCDRLEYDFGVPDWHFSLRLRT